MTMKEARELGFDFTGSSWNIWRDSADYIEKIKAEAKKIKQSINGADYVIVRGKKGDWLGSSHSYALMGNTIYCKYEDEFNYHYVEKSSKSAAARRAEIVERQMKELEIFDADHEKDLKFLEEYNKLLKK